MDDDSYLLPDEKEWRKKQQQSISIEKYTEILPFEMRAFMKINGGVGYRYDIDALFLIKQLEISLQRSKYDGTIINFIDNHINGKSLLYHVKIYMDKNTIHLSVIKNDDMGGSIIILSARTVSIALSELDRMIDFLRSDY